MSRKIIPLVLTLFVVSSLFLTGCTPSAEEAKAYCAPRAVDYVTWYGSVFCQKASTSADADTTSDAIYNLDDLAFFAGGVQGWPDGPDNVNYAGLFNLETLRDGISLQAYWSQWSTDPTFMDWSTPTTFEPGNDGAFQILVVGDTVYIPNRGDSSGLEFWKMSYAKLLANGKLRLCESDTTASGDWEGEGYGECTDVEGFPLSEIASHLPGDLSTHWYHVEELMENTTAHTNVKPEYGQFYIMWVQPE